ncbi:MAG: hypothetical protein D6732_00675, partial [Methanobacteriota archaeon]
MQETPRWFRPVSFVALFWNLLGCAAYLSDVTMSSEDIAQLSQAEQAMYLARPAWAVGATAIAVWAGALGSLGLVLRKRWATPFLWASLLGVIVQDIALFGIMNAASVYGIFPVIMQGIVLLIAIGLV